MLKTLKRKIALVAVAALGSAGLAVIAAPAANAADNTAGTDLTVGLIASPTTTGGLRLTEAVGSTAGVRIYDVFTTQAAINVTDLQVTVTGTFATIASDTAALVMSSGALAAGAGALTRYNTFSLNPAASGRTGSNGVAGATLTGAIGTTTQVGGGAASGTNLASTTTAAATPDGTILNIWNDLGTPAVIAADGSERRAIIRVYTVAVTDEATFASANNLTSVRTDDVARDATPGAGTSLIALSATAANANDFVGATVSVTWRATPTSSAVNISTENNDTTNGTRSTLGSGVDINYSNTTSGARALGKPVNGVYTIANASNVAGNGAVTINGGAEVIQLRLGRNAVPGIYTLNVDTPKPNTTASVTSISITIAETPATIALTGNTSLTAAESATGAGNTTFNFSTADSAGRASYFLGTEKVTMAVSGGAVIGRVSITSPAIPTIGSGTMSATAVSQRVPVTVAAAAGAAGAYTITTTASGFATTAVTPAATTSTLTVTSDANVSAAATRFTNATTGATGTNNLVDPTVFDAAAATDNTSPVATFLPVDQTKITLTATFPSTTVGDAKVTVTSSTIPGVTAGTIVIKSISAGTATFEFNATGTAATQTARFSLQGTSTTNLFQLDVTYAAAVPGEIDLTPIETGNSALVAVGSTNTLKASVLDQFGRALPGATVVFTIPASQRATARAQSFTTDAKGEASFTLADTSTSTTVVTNTVNVTVTGATQLGTSTVTYVYGDAKPAAVTLAAAQNSGAQAGYGTTITSTVGRATTVDTSLGAANNTTVDQQTADQVRVTATITAANTTIIRGQKVTISGDAGVFFAAGAGPTDVDLAVATRKNTLELYTDTNGQVVFQVAYTKSGSAVNISVKAGDVTSTWPIRVNAGDGAVIALSGSGSNVTATLTDAWGNPVAANVTMTVTGGLRFSNGFSSTTGTTAADGTISTEVQGSGTGTVTASHTGANSTIAASTTYGTAAGVASATQSVTGAALNAATDTAINAVKNDVKAVSDTVKTLSNAVTTIQSSVTELTSSFSAQIKSLSSAIAKISRAIAALSKRIR